MVGLTLMAAGLFLLLMMTGARRNEMNSLTDCLVYAGLVGAGFAWFEDIMYIADGESLADSLVTAALRLVMAPFAHSPVPAGEDTDWTGGFWMLGIGVAAAAIAVASMRRRELATGG